MEAPHEEEAKKVPPKDTMEEEQEAQEAGQLLKIDAKGRPFDAALFGETVVKGFEKMYNNPLLSDISLVVGLEKLPAHRMVLCAWSDTFRSMLENKDWAESSLHDLPIHLDDPEDQLHFKNMLRYMYTGSIDFVSGDNIIPLIRLSDYYGILSLKEICGDLLGEQINEDNLFFLLDIVEQFDCRRLNAHCGEFLAEHFGDMWTELPERLMGLKVDTWAEMLKSNELHIRSEEELYEAVISYANQFKAEPQMRDKALTTLLPLIRFPYLRPRFLVQQVETDKSVMHLPIVHSLLYEAYRFRMYPAAHTTFRTEARRGFQRFDRDHCSSAMQLSDDELKATLSNSSGWNNVRCVCPLSPSYNYVEFKADNGPNMMIGIVDGDCGRNAYAGQFSNGWTYYSQGGLYHAGGTPATGARYSPGDTIGVEVDFASSDGKINFYRNGQLSVSLTGIPKESTNLYPVVCCSAMGDAVSIVVGAVSPADEKAGKKRSSSAAKKARAVAPAPAHPGYDDPHPDDLATDDGDF